MQIVVFSSEAEWIHAAVEGLLAAADSARKANRSSLSLCLAGGLTPEPVYRAMSTLSFEGLAVDLWLGDERVVPPGDAARNGDMISRAFAGCSWTPPPRLRLWPEAETEAEAASACERYEAELRASLGPEPGFDLAILGLGADGHTASLFPASPILLAPAEPFGAVRLAATARSPLPPLDRMTLTLAALRSARRRIFLVKGADKLPALRKLEAEDSGIPASLIAGPGDRALYLDSPI
jgi:6-phosphogluconolactonase